MAWNGGSAPTSARRMNGGDRRSPITPLPRRQSPGNTPFLWPRPQRRGPLGGMIAPSEEGRGAMRAYLKAVAITLSLLGAWLALLPLVA